MTRCMLEVAPFVRIYVQSGRKRARQLITIIRSVQFNTDFKSWEDSKLKIVIESMETLLRLDGVTRRIYTLMNRVLGSINLSQRK